MEIAIVLFEGFDELDAIGPYEVFGNAARAGADCATTLRTVDETALVEASHGLRIEPDGRVADADPDLLLVPGGGWNDPGVGLALIVFGITTLREGIEKTGPRIPEITRITRYQDEVPDQGRSRDLLIQSVFRMGHAQSAP